MEEIKNVIKSYVKDRNLRRYFDEQRAVEYYNTQIAEEIRSVSKAVTVKNRDLVVNVINPMVANNLTFLQHKIVEEINDFLKYKVINKLYFRIGDVEEEYINLKDEENYIENEKISFGEAKKIVKMLNDQNVSDKILRKELFRLFSSMTKHYNRSNKANE